MSFDAVNLDDQIFEFLSCAHAHFLLVCWFGMATMIIQGLKVS